MVRNASTEEAQERPREPEAHEPHLAAVRVAREHQIPLPFRQVPERAGIVQEDDAGRSGLPRVLSAHAFEVLFAASPHEVHSDDLHRPRLGLDVARLVDQKG